MISHFIPLASPDIREEDILEVISVLKSGMLINGKYAAALEEVWANFIQVNHATTVSNGTATLHLALKALEIGHGDEVIVPALSYIATANVVELVGAKCIFVDVDERTFTIDVQNIEKKITSRTKAIIPVHEFGLSANMTAIMDIANKNNIKVIEDAACALGAKHNDNFAGSFGDFGSFSMHPRKSITSGEGGILTTNNAYLLKKVNTLKNHGIEFIDGSMEFVEAGFNYRLTDIQAALAYSQFKRINDIINYKQTLAEVYLNEIKSNSILLPYIPESNNHTWQTFHILLSEDLDQSSLIRKLKENNIGVNYGAQCIPDQIYYKNKYNLDADVLFPNAYRAYKKGLALPIYEKLSKEDIYKISKIVNNLC